MFILNHKPGRSPLHVEICVILFMLYVGSFVMAKVLDASIKGVDFVLHSANLAELLAVTVLAVFGFVTPNFLIHQRHGMGWCKFKYQGKWLFVLNIFSGVGFIFSKIYVLSTLSGEGYAFDTGEIDSPGWKASIFVTEVLVLFSIIWLCLEKFWKSLVNLLLIQINLFHGTRVYLLLAFLIIFYLCFRGLSWYKFVLSIVTGFILLVVLSYWIFLSRHGLLNGEYSTDLEWVLSPILIESVFSQWSLVNVLNKGWDFFDVNVGHFITDPIIYTAPRVLFPEKEAMLLPISSVLSPLGGFNGVAASIVYLGPLFMFYWLAWGGLASGLYIYAKSSFLGRVLYFIFCFNICFRLMRDGYLIPAKIFADDFLVLFFILFLLTVAGKFERIYRTRDK